MKTRILLILTLLCTSVMANFEISYEITNGHEGGYVFDTLDRGGETVDGISRKYWPKEKVWKYVDMAKKEVGNDSKAINAYLKRLPQYEQAKREFYKREFFDSLLLSHIDSQAVANELYDTAVNQGVSPASKYLQRALNMLNRNELAYKDIAVDGDVGGITLMAVGKYFRYYQRYESGFAEKTLLKALNGEQYMKYVQIVMSDHEQERFFAGWLRRV